MQWDLSLIHICMYKAPFMSCMVLLFLKINSEISNHVKQILELATKRTCSVSITLRN